MSDATYQVEVGWKGRMTGVFRIGSSLIGGTDVIGATFGGNDFEDITSDVRSIRTRRGRSQDLGPMNAGDCTLILKDPDGKYNPKNDGSHINQLSNHSFETDVSGWNAAGTSTIERSTVVSKMGVASAKCTYGDDTNCGYSGVTLTAVSHYVSGWIYIPTSFDGSAVELKQEGFTGSSGDTTATCDLGLRDQWQRVSFSFTPAAGDLSGSIVLRLQGASAGKFVYLDGVQVQPGALTDYIAPLYGMLLPMRTVRIRATFDGTTYGLFYGFIRRIESDPSKKIQEARIECIDLFSWLQRAYPTIASLGATTTGAAIGEILDAIEWRDPAMRDLDTGDDIPDFSSNGTKSALNLIQDLLTAERGDFYIDKDGQATYEDRLAVYRTPRLSAQTTITDVMRDILPSVDLDRIKNRATVTRTGGSAQTYTDSNSRYNYGFSDVAPITTDYLNNDTEAMSLARWLVSQQKRPSSPTRLVTLTNATDALLTAILSRDLLDRVSLTENLGGTSLDGHIFAIEHNIVGKTHVCIWRIMERTTEVFRIGTSLIGSTHVIGY